jgi:hypothetical protein
MKSNSFKKERPVVQSQEDEEAELDNQLFS